MRRTTVAGLILANANDNLLKKLTKYTSKYPSDKDASGAIL